MDTLIEKFIKKTSNIAENTKLQQKFATKDEYGYFWLKNFIFVILFD